MEEISNIKRLRLHHDVVPSRSLNADALTRWKWSGCDGERREFESLDADVLGEVLPYL